MCLRVCLRREVPGPAWKVPLQALWRGVGGGESRHLPTPPKGRLARVKCMKPSFPQKPPLLVWARTRLTTWRGSSGEITADENHYSKIIAAMKLKDAYSLEEKL